MSAAPHAFFLPCPPPSSGQRHAVFHAARGDTVRGRVVYVHPFAEEMNKSRRMAALQARALAAAGFHVLQIDLLGCGDSSGDFGDATWDAWIDDVVRAAAWLRDRAPDGGPLWLWGLRTGCLLASAAAASGRLGEPCDFCFWHPTALGATALQQFLRLKLAADLLAGSGKGVVESLRQQLARGEAVEVAGYRLSAGLAHGLQAATLAPPPAGAPGGRLVSFELVAQADDALSPAAARLQAAWSGAGHAVDCAAVQGPSFWTTTEIEDAPRLLDATVAALRAPATCP